MRTERNLPFVNAFGTVDISSAKNLDDALELAGLDWNVNSEDIYDANSRLFGGYKANVRDVDGALLGIVSDKYKIVQNRDAFEFVDALSEEGGFKFTAAGEFRGGKSVWVMGELPQTTILGDDVSNNIVFVNSHDGSQGVKVMMTPVRLICSNMINLATKEAKRIWKAKHTTRINTRLEEAKYTLGLANHYIEALNEEAERLSEIKISEEQIMSIFDNLFPVDKNKDTQRKINNVTLMRNNLMACLNADDIQKFRGNAWWAINAVSDMVSHREPNRKTKTFYEGAWNSLINGDVTMDKFHKALIK